MKKLINIFVLIMLAVLPAKAEWEFLDWLAWVAGNQHAAFSDQSESFTIYYNSYDANKNKVRLSAKVYYSKDIKTVERIILNCHPTVTENRATPTGNDPLDKDIKRMILCYSYNTIVVCPDYCGYGVSSHLQHPYLINDITARNCIDAVMEAINESVRRQWIFPFTQYRTDIVGFSQGGATALACTKYLESDLCPQNVKDAIRLYQTSCGDGPYSPVETVKKYLEWGKPDGENMDMEYACVLPLIVAAAKESYGSGCMRTVKIEDYFSDKFNEAGIVDLIKTKNVGTDVLDKKIEEAMNGRKRPVDVFSDKIINKRTGEFNTTTNEYKCLMRALDMADLTKGWVPRHDIYFFHLKNDKTVPYANYEAIMKPGAIGDLYGSRIHKVDEQKAYDDIFSEVKKQANVNDIDINKISHSTAGIVFYSAYMYTDQVRAWPWK